MAVPVSIKKEYKFDPRTQLLLTRARVRSSTTPLRLNLIWDSGSEITHMDLRVLDRLSPQPHQLKKRASVFGVGGKESEGIFFQVPEFSVFGASIQNYEVLFSDFSHWHDDEISGLLGFDIIKRFHHEMNGRTGTLNIQTWSPF